MYSTVFGTVLFTPSIQRRTMQSSPKSPFYHYNFYYTMRDNDRDHQHRMTRNQDESSISNSYENEPFSAILDPFNGTSSHVFFLYNPHDDLISMLPPTDWSSVGASYDSTDSVSYIQPVAMGWNHHHLWHEKERTPPRSRRYHFPRDQISLLDEEYVPTEEEEEERYFGIFSSGWICACLQSIMIV